MSRRARRWLTTGLRLALLGCLAGCSRPSDVPARPDIEIRQGDLNVDEHLPPTLATTVARVLDRNRAFLGAHPIDFCPQMPAEQRRQCLAEVSSVESNEIAGPVKVVETEELRDGGKQWPKAESVEHFRRVRLSVPLRKGSRSTTHEVQVVVFDSQRDGRTERCVFPLEHWTWSELDRPERFAQAPVGECDGRTLTVTQFLLEGMPDAAPTALRFLSEPEARAWQQRDPERIKWDSPYTAGHPYAKYFLLDSTRWWRGGRPLAGRDDYAWAVRIEHLPLARIRSLEESGDLFLDVFEDAAQIELTNVTEAGLEALLRENPSVLIDASTPDDEAPRLEPPPD